MPYMQLNAPQTPIPFIHTKGGNSVYVWLLILGNFMPYMQLNAPQTPIPSLGLYFTSCYSQLIVF